MAVMPDSTRKKLCDAALNTLLAIIDPTGLVKGSAIFVKELSGRFKDLPDDQIATLASPTNEEMSDVLGQLRLATDNSASAAAGVARVEEEVRALRLAMHDHTPKELERRPSRRKRGRRRDSPPPPKEVRSISNAVVDGMVFLLLLDQYPEGVWGRTLARISGAWGHGEDPGSITVSYWALQGLVDLVGDDELPELDRFHDFLVRRMIEKGSMRAVGMMRNVGSDFRPKWEIVENRRHILRGTRARH